MEEWIHRFIHIPDTIPKNWYIELEMHRETSNWDKLTHRFKVIFTFEYKSPSIHATLQDIQMNIFSEEGLMEVVPVCDVHRDTMIVHELLECFNVAKEQYDEEDPKNMQIPKK
jgi:hypothetical protein